MLYPVIAYSSIPTLTTTDSSLFTFGTDSNGYAISPMGASIYPSLDSIPSNPWKRGRDYIAVGATGIRIPNNGTYSGTLYWVGITPPQDITNTVVGNYSGQPSLFPEASRELIAIKAAARFFEEASRNIEASDRLYAQYDRRWKEWALTWRTQYTNGGALGVTGLGLAQGGLYQSANII